eukprot:CAMPEP_0178452066 /NCGR_PEP_ID=MMETSP0689_2-20121128/44034_1 /TAXON_ID=160604 /ORGANISM="Amphidinium massartii, Strain CS-259" /LENGTH=520 /DNA_ID=CAMNT_0020077723 /DNA_START=84 /DNA_END=1646 /DNA_ORIENTATION=-
MTDEKKKKALQEKFNKMDKNGDGRLDFSELLNLLRSGNPNMATKEVRQLFNSVDADGSGTVEFKEFVDYIYSTEKKDEGPIRTTDARHEKLARDNAAKVDDTEGSWDEVEAVFMGFAGKDKDLDSREFLKVCVDCNLFDRKYTKNDCDIVFKKASKGGRRIRFAEFKDALRYVADKKGCGTGKVQELVGSSEGPVLHATKADAVRFHDDKSTYTGAHVFNEKHGDHTGGGERSSDQRHERLQEQSAARVDDDEGAWGDVQGIFNAFAGHNRTLEQKEFAKVCQDCGLFDRKFNKNDCDIIFTKVKARGQRHIGFDAFQDAVRLVAQHKKVPVREIQDAIGNSEGPVLKGTQADNVRFHDDKSTYTGAHAHNEKHGDKLGGEMGADRHEKMVRDNQAHTDDTEGDWQGVEDVFSDYAGGNRSLEGKEFAKLFSDCGLFDKKFNKNDCDIIFAKIVTRGQRHIGLEQFKDGVRLAAAKKGETIAGIQGMIENSSGPVINATKADAVRFHDDKSSYTGMHVGK